MNTCLSIAGSDSSGGAGIQADLKTFAAHGVYGMSAITALTAQNTQGVHAIETISPKFVAQQIDAVLNDIPADAIKLGMLVNRDIIRAVAQQLKAHNSHNVVLDPVMIATSGDALLDPAAVDSLVHDLFPYVDLITPNTAELIALCKALGINTPQQDIDQDTLKQLSIQLHAALPSKHDGTKIALLSKGGHLAAHEQKASDYLIDADGEHWFTSTRINTNNTHGTGCTLSAAISANLAQDHTLSQACANAKEYLQRALNSHLDLGHGNGPLNHLI